MPQEFYCQIDGRETGPHSVKEIQRLACEGELKPEDLVRQPDSSRWVAASKLKGLVFKAAAPEAFEPQEPQREGKRDAILGVPSAVARSHVVYPISQSDGKLRLLAGNPSRALNDTLRSILSGEIELIAAPAPKVRTLIDQNYAPEPTPAPTPAPPQTQPPTAIRQRVHTRLGTVDIVDLSTPSEPRPPESGSLLGRIWRSIVLSRYASRITAKVRDTNPSRASGLYDHEPYLQALGRKIHVRYGLQGMKDVFLIVEKRKGRGVTSELGRIWRTVGDWSY